MTIARHLSRLVLILLVLAPAALPAQAGGPPVPRPLDPEARLCATPIAAAERRHTIPGQLLAAVAVAESGRWRGKDRAVFAWPWTVTSGSRSWFFPERTAAVAHTRTLLAQGVRNIDVGCMQVNLGYHGHAFADVEAAFDPEINVAYAAGFLAALFEKRRSWALAVGFYHSSTPKFQNRYRRKVMALWNQERRRAAAERRHAVQAQFARDRQARLRAQEAARAVTSASPAADPQLAEEGTPTGP